MRVSCFPAPRLLSWIAVFGLVLTTVAIAPAVAEEEQTVEEMPLNFNAVAANMSNFGRGGAAARLAIRINRWSTPEERQALLDGLKTGNRRGLPDALFNSDPVGTIREVSRLANDLRYSRQIPKEDGGRVIIAALDRPLHMLEMWQGTRTKDYNVTLIVLDLDKDGRGDGQIAVGAEFVWDEAKQQVTITNFASEPIRLTQVSLR